MILARITLQEACKFDKSKHIEISNSVENNAKLVDDVVNELVGQYSKELDAVIAQAHEALSHRSQLADNEIDFFILKIPMSMYYSSVAQEEMGIREDVSRMIRQRLYIDARQSASGTIDDKNTAAEAQVMQETLTAAAYKRATNILKAKNTAAQEVLSAFKKVLSRRMEEYQLTRFGGSSE